MPQPFQSLRRVWRHQRVRMVGRVGVMVALAVGGTLAAEAGGAWWWAAALAGILVMAQVAGLVQTTERTARYVLRFLEGIRYDDFSGRFSGQGRGALQRALAEAFEEVSEAFRTVRAEREEQAHYLQAVVRHVGVAVIAYRGDGSVTLFNTAARRLLGVPGLGTIDALRRVDERLAQAIQMLEPGRRALVRLPRQDRVLELVLFSTRFQLGGEAHTLVSLQDIRQELEEKETEAWQQLTRVLTHEIMNSIAPITSLAATAQNALDTDAAHARDTAREALATIEKRGNGLVSFVDAYRSLTRVPQPHLRLVPLAPLFDGVCSLLKTSARAQNVTLETRVEPPTLEVAADAELIEQVLINLTLNALQAMEGRGHGRVTLRAEMGETGRAVVRVEDDGPGILPEVQERIFVPFFTTKSGGSGIGLSLSRQILRQHGGTITVRLHARRGRDVHALFLKMGTRKAEVVNKGAASPCLFRLAGAGSVRPAGDSSTAAPLNVPTHQLATLLRSARRYLSLSSPSTRSPFTLHQSPSLCPVSSPLSPCCCSSPRAKRLRQTHRPLRSPPLLTRPRPIRSPRVPTSTLPHPTTSAP